MQSTLMESVFQGVQATLEINCTDNDYNNIVTPREIMKRSSTLSSMPPPSTRLVTVPVSTLNHHQLYQLNHDQVNHNHSLVTNNGINHSHHQLQQHLKHRGCNHLNHPHSETSPLVNNGGSIVPKYGDGALIETVATSPTAVTTGDGDHRPAKPWSWLRWLKIALLIMVIIAALVSFMCVGETKDHPFLVIIKEGKPKYINLTNELDMMSPVWTIKARGPFIPEELANLTEYDVFFSIVETDERGYRKLVRGPWSVPIAPPGLIQTLNARQVEHAFNMKPSSSPEYDGYDKLSHYQLKISTTVKQSTVVTLTISTFTELSLQGILISCLVLVFLYVLIIFEVVERTLAAMIGATAAIACLTIINNRPSLEKVVSWLDIETLALLFGMMVMVAILCETGFFDYVAVLAFRLAKGRIWPLIIILCLFTAVLSAFLDNVTTILLMTPITIRLCEIKNIDPKHVLIAQVIFSNIGGAATPVGDPPNVIIISSQKINQMGVTFTTFTLHVMPGILVCIVATIFLLRFLYRDIGKFQHRESGQLLARRRSDFGCPQEQIESMEKLEEEQQQQQQIQEAIETSEGLKGLQYQENLNLTGTFCGPGKKSVSDTIICKESMARTTTELKREIEVWKKAYNSIVGYSKDESSVREILRKKVANLESYLEKNVLKSRPNDEELMADYLELSEKYRIRNKPLLIKAGIVMIVVILLFFLQTIPTMDLSLGWISILGSIAILIVADFEELESIFRRVEWSTLIFFAALFVVMEALSELKLLLLIGQLTQDAINSVGEEHRLIAAILLILWVSALASSFIDNIPFATVMVRIVEDLARTESLKIPMTPLVYALAFGACLGGNGTLIGASANVVCAGIAEQHGYKFTFMDFFRIGFPVMLLTVTIASFYLLLIHVVLGLN